jgi:hypothetical protein
MKNILLIIICFLGINAYGQFPINQTTGSPTTLVKSRGGQGADSGFVYPTFLDTARMNGGFLKNIAGIMLRQGDTLWLRNKTATKWLPIIAGASGGSGSYVDTIYRKLGQDSIFYTINGGAERSIKDSIGGGGSGSIEYVVSGTSIRVDSSGRTYTVNADTGRGNSQLITGASLNSVADSIGDLIDLKPNVGDVILNQLAKQTGKRFDIQSGKFDSLYASTATGLILANNSAAEIGRFGAGGGTTVTWQGLNTFSGGATINGTTTIGSLSGILKASTGVVGTAVSGTDLKTINGTSIIGSGDIVTPDNGITALTGDVTASGSGSVVATLATVNGNVGTFKKATVTANGKGLVTAISEGFGVDTVYRKAGQDSIFYTINGGTERAVKDSVGSGSSGVNYITADKAYVGVTSGKGSNGTDGGTNANGRNILIGDSAGHSIGSAIGITAIGYRAAYSLRSDSGAVAIGYNALSTYDSSDNANTKTGHIAIGRNALRFWVGGLGLFNSLAIGKNALSRATTNYQNLAIGDGVMANMTTGGIGNIGIGFGVLGSSSSGVTNENTVIGFRTAESMTAGSSNFALGALTLQLATTANNNVAIGSGVLRNPTGTVSSNIAIGNSAMAGVSGSSGTNNIAIGGSSLSAFTSGTSNVAIGGSAGAAINSGFYNTLIGHQAGGGITSASSNTITGAIAGAVSGGFNCLYGAWSSIGAPYTTRGLTTGTGNIILGSYASPPSSTSNNQIQMWVAGTGNNAGYNAATRFTGGGWLFNQTTSEVTTQTASAALEINGVTRGFLPPRLTTGDRNSIASPAAGLSVYNSSLATNDIYTTAWYQQPNGLSGSGTLDFPSTGAHSSSDLTITVTGAAVGDIVMLGTPVQDIDGTFTAFVSAPNTVTVRYNHYGSGTNNPASGTFKVYVIKN